MAEAAMQGANLLIMSNLDFTLPTQEYFDVQEEPTQRAFHILDDLLYLLSHSRRRSGGRWWLLVQFCSL